FFCITWLYLSFCALAAMETSRARKRTVLRIVVVLCYYLISGLQIVVDRVLRAVDAPAQEAADKVEPFGRRRDGLLVQSAIGEIVAIHRIIPQHIAHTRKEHDEGPRLWIPDTGHIFGA